MLRLAKKTIRIILIVLFGAMLVGCEPALNGQISVSATRAGVLVVGVCKDIRIASVRIFVLDDQGRELFKLVGDGSRQLKDGESLDFDELQDEFASTEGRSGRPPLAPGTSLHVFLYKDVQSAGGDAFGVFRIPEAGLHDGVWLFSDESTSERVCGAYEEAPKLIEARSE